MMFCRPQLPAISTMLSRTLVAMGLTLLINTMSACIILPTPGHGGYGVISSEDVESLVPRETTRADVLLRFGNPAERVEGDRIFVYRWSRIHAYAVPLIGPAPAQEIMKVHYLGIEFGPDTRVKRFKLFDPSVFEDRNQHLQDWMATQDEPNSLSNP